MIPSINTIVEDLLAGTIDKGQAIGWLNEHAETAGRDLMDEFAMAALPALIADPDTRAVSQMVGEDGLNVGFITVASGLAYQFAEAMFLMRQK